MTMSKTIISDAKPELLEDGWEIGELCDAGLDPEIIGSLVQAIETDDHPDFHSLLIARHGRLVFDSYFHGYNSTHLHDIRSAGKSFTSTLIGIALDHDAIPDIETPISTFFKKYEPYENFDARKEAITVRDLLMMMSGLDADDNDASSPGYEDNMLKADDWFKFGLDLPMREEPGQRWVYAGANTFLLARILEISTNRSLLDFAIPYLFEPLGIESFLWQTSPQGVPAGQGFLSVCSRDMLKLGQLFLDGGSWQGRRIVSKKWTEAATKLQVKLPNESTAGYGYQWWMPVGATPGQFMGRGIYGQYLYIDKGANVVIVTTGADKLFREPGVTAANVEMFRQIVAASEGQ